MKNKRKFDITTILNVIAYFIILHGIISYCDLKLWKESSSEIITLVKVFLPIVVLGLSAILIGLSNLLKKLNK